MKSYIILDNVVFYAHHGVFAQETCVGNTFVVNLKLEVDVLKACQTDDVNDTISYADVYEIVKSEMNISSKLIEHAAYRIILRLRDVYPQIMHVELKLSKQNPPLGGQLDYASVLLID